MLYGLSSVVNLNRELENVDGAFAMSCGKVDLLAAPQMANNLAVALLPSVFKLMNMKQTGRRANSAAYVLALLSFLAPCGILSAASVKMKQTERAGPAPGDAKDFAAFFDAFFANEMPRWHVPGAALVLVKDGKVIFSKGYGYANIEDQTPVVPDHTVFRVASVSKVFTATAVMQLAESGKLDLNADVNSYLSRFKVKDPYPQPVTSAELLTHSAGLDDSVFGLAARNPSQVVPLGAFLARHMPSVVMPPGKIYSYSSYGIALEGYLVQKLSGEPFDAYIEKNILQPLDMRSSGFELTPKLAAHLATGYEYHRGRYIAEPVDYFNIPPAVGLYSTATDMAHFLIAQMEDGRYGDRRILSEAAAEKMHQRQFAEDPRLAGRTFGFYERYVNGYRAIGHGGNIRGFASLLLLVPEEHVGFFLVFNRDESRFEDDLIRRFFNHFYPPKNSDAPSPLRLSTAEMSKYTGSYRSNPYSRRTFEKLITLYWQYRITANPDGSLEFHYPHEFKPPSRWVALGPDYFECSDGQGHAVFKTGNNGRVAYLFTDRDSYEKVPWYATAAFQVALVKVLMVVLLSGCIWWPVYWLVQRLRKKSSSASGALRWARWTAAILGVLNVFFIVEMLHLLNQMDDWDFVYGVPVDFKALLWIPIVTTALAAVVVGFAVWVWWCRSWSLAGRIHYSVIAAAALVFVWFFAYWNLLGFRY
jgi:CubicO group peptidase (beta-lactamase class C family)